MILVDLAITDYKQFAGTHRFTPAPNGVVAVIGTNGAGKTTLFEAIEWCLFQPREIPNAEVPPRGGSSPTKVVLTLHDPRTGDVYTVERRLRNGMAAAEIARTPAGDGAREVVVTGTRQVTEYVWRTLVGLDHRAFVATFFTRQKELSFFGNSRPTERRREVQRLLGLETIRKAQETLAEDRRKAASSAESLLAQVAETAASRDFDAELTAAQAEVAIGQRTVAERRAAVQRQELAHLTAQRAVDEQTERQRQDAALAAELAGHAAAIAAATRAAEAAEREIARLTSLAATRGDVQRLAATAEEARRRVDELEALRARHDRHRQATRELGSARGQLTAEGEQIGRLVAGAPLHSAPGWVWAAAWTRSDRDSSPDADRVTHDAAATSPSGLGEAWSADVGGDPVAAIDRLLDTTEALAIPEREGLLRLLETARDAARAVAEAEADVARFQAKLAALASERDLLFSDGDPDDEIAHIDDRERAVDAELAQRGTTIRLMTETMGRLRAVADRLAGQDFSDLCPTCGRPFTAHDARASEEHARAQLREHEEHVAALQAAVAADTARRATFTAARSAALARRVEIAAVNDRIGKGEGAVRAKEEALAASRAAVDATLATLGRADAPADAEITDARRRLAAERAVHEAVAAIRGRRGAVVGLVARVAEGEATLAEIGEVSFDPTLLSAARGELEASTAAGARLAEMEDQLARMPERVAARDEAVTARVAAEAASVDVEGRRSALGFDPQSLTGAKYDLEDAVEDERNARGQLTAAEVAHQAAVGRVEQVERERAAHAALAVRADERARERDTLDEMVKEFNHFDRFVTQRVRPQMEDLTSELVRIVTDDKYPQVVLDDDYGVHVVDGDGAEGSQDRFPLEQFSGGERDVVALCARLSLSRIIGAQAPNPPRFLVLDEVFGSLDRERRLNLLEMLSNLAGSADVFQQLFVISHLDDVRTSSAFTEVWRVAEQGDGSSRLENLNLTGGAEEL